MHQNNIAGRILVLLGGFLLTASAAAHDTLPYAGSTSANAPAFAVTNTRATGLAAHGLSGESRSNAGRGVYGLASSPQGNNYGVYGLSMSTAGRGVYGHADAGSGTTYGVYGQTRSTKGRAVYGLATATTGTNFGLAGESRSSNGYGVNGFASASSGKTIGVGAHAKSTEGVGVYALASAHSGTNYGVYAKTNSADGYAGYFSGRVLITGTLTKGSGSFKIDHPLDPENRYLSHSFVESPDMMNVYNGNATLDGNGEALVGLPAYFEALNRDFRYQLTALGAPAPNLHIAAEITDNRFKIAGGEPGMRVSWQVTGIRQDPWAETHRVVVEEEKPAADRGRYLHPGLYGDHLEGAVQHVRSPHSDLRR